MTNIIFKSINSIPLHRLERLRSYPDSDYIKIRIGGEKFYVNDTIPNVIDFREILEDEADSPFLIFLIVKSDDMYKMETEKGWFSSANVSKCNLDEINSLVKTQKDFHEMIMDVGAGGCYVIIDCGVGNEIKQKEIRDLIVKSGGIESHVYASSSPIDTIIGLVSNWGEATTV